MRIDAEYDRISEDKSGIAEGPDSQHDENTAFGAELGIQFGRRYTDNDLSAFSGVERPQYEELLRDMAAGQIRSLTFWHANRLHRRTDELPRFVKLARKHKITLYCTTRQGPYNLETASGRKALRDDTSSAEYESEHRGERVTLARKRQARNGDYGGGLRPFGWGVDTGRVRSVCLNPKASTMERVYEDRSVLDMTRHNPEEAEEIRRWARELLSGVPMNQVLRDMAGRGVLTVSQKKGRKQKRNGQEVPHEGWNSKTLRNILTSPRTSGHSVYQGKIVQRNLYPAILEEDVRQALITLFQDPKRKTSPGNTPKWLGSLIFQCGFCNDGSATTVRRNAQGIPVYRCRPKGHGNWPAERVNRYIENLIVERLARDDLADLIPNEKKVDFSALREERKTQEGQKTRAGISFARGAIDEETLETIVAECNKRINEIREELKSASAEDPLSEFLDIDNVEDAKRVWESRTLGRKREIVRRLFDVTLQPVGRGRDFSIAHITVEGRKPPRSAN